MHFSRFSRFSVALTAVALAQMLTSLPPVHAQTSSGGLDASFGVGPVGGQNITTIVQQADGKVLLGGINFTSLNGVAVGSFTRVNADGSADLTFKQPLLESYNTRTDNIVTVLDPKDYQPVVQVIVPQAGGKVLVGGNYYFVNGASGVGGLLRFNSDGSVDTTFRAPRFGGTVYTVVPTSNGGFLVGGDFTTVDSAPRTCVVRLKANGTLDTSFNGGVFSGVLQTTNPDLVNTGVRALVVQGDGKVVIGGNFANIAGVAFSGLARLNSDGSLDGSYSVDARFNVAGTYRASVVAVYALALQSSGKTLVGGELIDPNFDPAQGVREINALFRFNPDGSIDGSFNPSGTGTNSVVDAIVLQPDGNIIIGGFFDHYNGVQRVSYARLFSDGTLDTSFDSSVGANDEVFALGLQSDGKLLLGGFFAVVDGIPVQSAARVNTQAGVAPAVTVSVGTTVNRALLATLTTKGVFTLTRSGGNISAPLTVPYILSGTAQKGFDYKVNGTTVGTVDFFASNGSVTIPAGSTQANIKIKPLFGSIPARKRSVVIDLNVPATSIGVSNGETALKIVDKSVAPSS